MKSFNRLFAAVIAAMAAVFLGANLIFICTQKDGSGGRPYRVEAERIAARIETGDFITPSDLGEYVSIVGVTKRTQANADGFFGGNSDYLIREIGGEIYRFDYRSADRHASSWLVMNGALAVTALGVALLLAVLRERIIKPFDRLREVPFELSKGNLVLPLKENRDRYFGRFVWGLDLLRQHLESRKQAELRRMMEKQRLILSVSHDVKTPLGVIELYAKALEKGLYTDEEKRRESARAICLKCEEIKGYINDIVSASNDDFLNFEVRDGEFYLSQVITPVRELYADRLALLQTDFSVNEYDDCLLRGDADRAAEVLQNLMENAIKYGDGKRVEITFADEEDCRLVSVVNTGCSLGENELPHIFDSFWRGSNVGSREGSGLGLYICRRLMRQMNGDIFAAIGDSCMTVTAVFRRT